MESEIASGVKRVPRPGDPTAIWFSAKITKSLRKFGVCYLKDIRLESLRVMPGIGKQAEQKIVAVCTAMAEGKACKVNFATPTSVVRLDDLPDPHLTGPEPTNHLPGTAGKVEVMARRFAAGQELYSHLDAQVANYSGLTPIDDRN